MRATKLIGVVALATSCGPTPSPEAPSSGWQPPEYRLVPPVRGQSLLMAVRPDDEPKDEPSLRPAEILVNQAYRPARRYFMPAAGHARVSVSPDGQGVAIAPDNPNSLVILRDVDDPTSEVVIDLGVGDPTRHMTEYQASEVAWCGGLRPTIFAADTGVVWAFDGVTFESLPGFPQHTPRGMYVSDMVCLRDGNVAMGGGMGPANKANFGALVIVGRDGVALEVTTAKFSPTSIALDLGGRIAVDTERVISMIDPGSGRVVDIIREVEGQPLASKYDTLNLFQGLLAASPSARELAVVMKYVGEDGPMVSRLDLDHDTLRPIPGLQALREDDRLRGHGIAPKPGRTGWETDELMSWKRAVGKVSALAYTPVGDLLLVGGQEDQGVWGWPGDWAHHVVWVVRGDELVDTLSGHLGYVSDVAALPDGRLVSLGGRGPGGELIVWARREATKAPSP